ncbi:MAG TPA: hypothetical protein VFQ41_02190 [Candidatus Angelobacter sp.]|nr:hypothetical protein [Candidatus Angelobacter sp.]
MPVRGDEQFEKYLKQFRPVAPEALAVKQQVRAGRRPLVLAARVGVAAVLFAVTVSVFLYWPSHQPGQIGTSKPGVEELNNSQPLTIAKANALLAEAPSFKVAVDNMAFQSESRAILEGRYSALALLSKEETKQ